MKLRWREHELIFVAMAVLGTLISIFYKAYNPSYAGERLNVAYAFSKAGTPFTLWQNLLVPQVALPLLFFLVYLVINLLLVPAMKKITFTDVEKLLTLSIFKPILLFIATSYLLAVGVNIITWYAKPHLVNYAGYQLLAILGYNEKPLANLFFGFDKATMLILVLTGLACLRELIMWFISRPGGRKEYRVMITNNITPLFYLYFLVLVLSNPLHENFITYFAWVTPILLLYTYESFWLFPFKGSHSITYRPVLIRLLIASMLASLPYFLVYRQLPFRHTIWFWLVLLFVATPLIWFLFEQRKERIIKLRGMETAMAQSKAELQFLQSQINPHFLFNSLNTLYGIALKEKSENTAEGIQKLGDMMRFMLHENNHKDISMNKEIEYLRNYISLQKLRIPLSEGILIEDNIEDANCNRTIAPMLLIPFVENAFKYGISFREKSWIVINLSCNDNKIKFEVKNSIHPPGATDPENKSSGIGLKNVAERLKLIYSGRHQLSIDQNGKEFIIKLEIY